MDKIFIHGLKLDCRIGFYPEELTAKQPLLLDLEIAIDTQAAAVSDTITDTIDYDTLLKSLAQWVGLTSFNLLETLGHFIATKIMDDFGASALRLRIRKQNINTMGAQVGIELTRGAIS